MGGEYLVNSYLYIFLRLTFHILHFNQHKYKEDIFLRTWDVF